MVTGINQTFLSGLFGGSSSSSSDDGMASLAGASSTLLPTPSVRYAPTAPWTRTEAATVISQRVKDALAGRKFIDESKQKLDLPGASADYKRLFALYNGLASLMSVAEGAGAKNLAATEATKLSKAFGRGLQELTSYVEAAQFEELRMVKGETNISAKTTTPVRRNGTEYLTPALVSGSSTAPVAAFQGDVKFNIAVKRAGKDFDVAIDLADMGGASRTVATVVNFINDKLDDAGVDTRILANRMPGQERTTEVNGKKVKLGPGPDQWGLKVKVSTGETVKFSAPATAGAVYVAQDAGDPDPDRNSTTNDGVTRRELVKFQTDIATVPPPLQKSGEANWVDGRVFSETLAPEIKAVRSTKTGADGSVYMLADVTGKVDGQEIKGAQDVALLKYDSSGKLMFARTLGAAGEARGLALALSDDGKSIGVAGAVKGTLAGAVDGAMNSGPASTVEDSFVTVFDAEGQEQWTQRRGAKAEDEASQIAFGADGTVYVAGRAKSAIPGSTTIGGWDSYLEAFKADAKGVIKPVFTTSFGTAGSDRPAGLVVDGTSVVAASVEDGRAVLRRFDVSGAAPVLMSTRDLGDLQGGDIVGLARDGGQLVIAGSTSNSALTGEAVSRGYTAGLDTFAARLNADLSAGGSIAFYGGSGNDRATALAVSGGQVWIAGAAGADLPNHAAAVGTKDGFLARLDVTAGTIDWSRRFTGKDRLAAPTSIAVDTSGSSVLDRIGLPKGELDLSDSQRLTAASSLRAGDQFTVSVNGGRPKTISITGDDTLDTLAQKIRRATGFQAKITVSSSSEGGRYLSVNPNNKRTILEFGAGSADRDALELLGIAEGAIRMTEMVDGKSVPGDGKGMLYGLGLESRLNLSNETERKHALAEIGAAMGKVREAYKDLRAASAPPEPEAKAEITGKVPPHLKAQLANYQAALQRLGG
jgi:hypothetical protein